MHSEKCSVLGVLIDVVDYRSAASRIMLAAAERRSYAVSALAVHGVMCAVRDIELRRCLNDFDMVTPDGQPVRWALNWLHGSGLRDRVYGPTLVHKVLQQAAVDGLPVYFYGSRPEVLSRLQETLAIDVPGLVLAGLEPSQFRTARPGETISLAQRITDSGARLVMVGLGCPRQEMFVAAMRRHLAMPLLAVGAAFDYHAGMLPTPPAFLQRRGLEWAWRLAHEPRRLWRRYLLLNPWYVSLLGAQYLRLWHPAVVSDTRAPLSVPV
jgi:N-acetylglucosaminyldiphosphoundecaprenol N-acetyl-beta-D-mannosaminyltransferase